MIESTDIQLAPANTEEVQQCVLAAASSGEPLEVLGSGTKRFFGRPVNAPRRLTVARLNKVVDYQPEELILVVQPGAPLEQVQATLAERNQILAFDPPHWGDGATIGGTMAANLSGPARFRMGAARDHLLGFQAVTGRGDIVRGGGRVVKNVTGYDLSKVMCGSFGTLAVMTELVVKVLPKPDMERTMVVPGQTESEALPLMIAAARSHFEVSALAYLPPEIKLPAGLQELLSGQETGCTLVRVDGPGPSVAHRCEGLQAFSENQMVFLEGDESHAIWNDIRELRVLPLEPGFNLWRASIPPTAATEIWKEFRILGAEQGFFDWGGGLIWVLLPEARRGSRIHEVVRRAGGHARLVKRGEGTLEDELIFPPLDEVKAHLHKNLKLAFDPEGILNPGRLYPEF